MKNKQSKYRQSLEAAKITISGAEEEGGGDRVFETKRTQPFFQAEKKRTARVVFFRYIFLKQYVNCKNENKLNLQQCS